MSTKYKVLLADDHRLMRAGLKSLIEKFGDFEVVGEADDGLQAVQIARHSNPDIAVIDLTMPGMNGLDAIARIAHESPNTRIIALSMHTSEHYVLEALRAGAKAYVVKDCAVDELECALRAVCRHESYLSTSISGYVLDALNRNTHGDKSLGNNETGVGVLTKRQREILQLIAEGHSTKDIADRLFISVKTVETHRIQLMRRLEIHDVASLTRFAIRSGMSTL